MILSHINAQGPSGDSTPDKDHVSRKSLGAQNVYPRLQGLPNFTNIQCNLLFFIRLVNRI